MVAPCDGDVHCRSPPSMVMHLAEYEGVRNVVIVKGGLTMGSRNDIRHSGDPLATSCVQDGTQRLLLV